MRLFNSDSSNARDRLSELVDDERQFIAVLEAFDSESQRRIFSGLSGGARALWLARNLIQRDFLDGVLALRNVLLAFPDSFWNRLFDSGRARSAVSQSGLQKSIRSARLPRIAYHLLETRQISLDQYLHLPYAESLDVLLRRSTITATQYLAHTPLDIVATWQHVTEGRIELEQAGSVIWSRMRQPRPQRREEVALLPMIARRLLQSKVVPLDEYLQLDYADTLDSLLRSRTITSDQYLAHPPLNVTETWQHVRDGLIPFRDAVKHLPPISLSQAAAWIGGHYGTWREWLAGPRQSRKDIKTCVNDRRFTARDLDVGGPNMAHLADLLFKSGAIYSSKAAQVAVISWDENEDFLACIRAAIQDYTTERAVLDSLPLPGDKDDPRNRPFLMRAVAEWLTTHRRDATWVSWGLEKIWSAFSRLFSTPAIEKPDPNAPQVPEPDSCIACGEDWSDETRAFKLAACKHPAEFDRECFLRGLGSGGGHVCPSTGCQARVNPSEALRLGLGAARANDLAEHAVVEARQADTCWRRCPTTGCPNGLQIQPEARAELDCRCCGKVTWLYGPGLTFSKLSTEDKAQVRLLVEGAAGTSSQVVRECYHCGTPTQHTEACMSMRCTQTRCGKGWNFVDGQEGRHQYTLEPQTYVPRQSWLLKLGMYDPLKAGDVGVDVIPVMKENLRRLTEE